MLIAVLDFVPDSDDPSGIIGEYLDKAAPGSYLAISHAGLEGAEPDKAEGATEQFKRSVTDFSMRTRAEITRSCDRLELVEPGVVYLPEWRPVRGTRSSNRPRLHVRRGRAQVRLIRATSLHGLLRFGNGWRLNLYGNARDGTIASGCVRHDG